jgi:hypothetical protein
MSETDSIPRVHLTDLFITLKEFHNEEVRSLDELRLKICANRQKSSANERYWATTRDIAVELQRLSLAIGGPFPKDRRAYDAMRHTKMKITSKGLELVQRFSDDRARAYDLLFCTMFQTHPYLQAWVKAILRQPLKLPVITSAKEHVSPRYAVAKVLVDDVAGGTFELDSLCANLRRRMQRDLNGNEETQIREGMWRLCQQWSGSAAEEEPSIFAKKFLQRINDVVLPAVMNSEHLTFDFKTYQTLWSFGKDWKLWDSTARHPDWDLRLVYKTASLILREDEDRVDQIIFDSGLTKTRERFLEKLFHAYSKLQQRGHGTFVIVDELRAVFCYDNSCQETVFDRLVAEHYIGSPEFELNMEIYRKSGQHDRPIRIGNRNIGLIRVVKR